MRTIIRVTVLCLVVALPAGAQERSAMASSPRISVAVERLKDPRLANQIAPGLLPRRPPRRYGSDPIWNGALIGGGVGLGLGVYACKELSGCPHARVGLYGGVLGALLGAVIDSER